MSADDLLGAIVRRLNLLPQRPRRLPRVGMLAEPIPVESPGFSSGEANLRASEMCRQLLPRQLWLHLAQDGVMKVESPSNRSRYYLVYRNGSVVRFEQGRRVGHCIAPDQRANLPPLDRAFAHYCHITGNETEYLSVANTTRTTT